MEKSLNEYPLEYQNQILREVLFTFFPFTFEDMLDYESNIDFKILSKNQYVNWNEEILIKFKDKWDWEAIQTNPLIIAYHNLAVLFPEIAGLPAVKCKCENQLSTCNRAKICYSEYNEELMKKDMKNPNHIQFTHWVNFLIEESYINSENLSYYLLYDTVIEDGNTYNKCVDESLKSNFESQTFKDNDIDSEDIPF